MAAPVIDSASIRFVVDDRERRSEVVGHLEARDGLAIHFERLPTGDYRADDRLLFERKRLDDFAASVIDGRLFSQLSRLVSGGYRPVLVLEGSTATLGSTRIRREALQGALITASVIFGVPVLRSFSSAETARLMVYTARKVRAVASGALPRHGRRRRDRLKGSCPTECKSHSRYPLTISSSDARISCQGLLKSTVRIWMGWP